MAHIKEEVQNNKTSFAVGKKNYLFMAIAFAIIIIGYLLMMGGGSKDPKVFNPDIFSFRRITLAPIFIFIGYVMMIFAIMKKPKD